MPGGFPYIDKHTYPSRRFAPEQGMRDGAGWELGAVGAYLARGVVSDAAGVRQRGRVCGRGDDGGLARAGGLCAQIGKRVHLSAAAQIGGVLEPVNASPVIIEDDVLVGGNTGVYEGTIVRQRAVLAAGTILTRGTPVYDVVNRRRC